MVLDFLYSDVFWKKRKNCDDVGLVMSKTGGKEKGNNEEVLCELLKEAVTTAGKKTNFSNKDRRIECKSWVNRII